MDGGFRHLRHGCRLVPSRPFSPYRMHFFSEIRFVASERKPKAVFAERHSQSHTAAQATARTDSTDTYARLSIIFRLRIPELIIDPSLIRNQLFMIPPLYNLPFVKHRNLIAEAAG